MFLQAFCFFLHISTSVLSNFGSSNVVVGIFRREGVTWQQCLCSTTGFSHLCFCSEVGGVTRVRVFSGGAGGDSIVGVWLIGFGIATHQLQTGEAGKICCPLGALHFLFFCTLNLEIPLLYFPVVIYGFSGHLDLVKLCVRFSVIAAHVFWFGVSW